MRISSARNLGVCVALTCAKMPSAMQRLRGGRGWDDEREDDPVDLRIKSQSHTSLV